MSEIGSIGSSPLQQQLTEKLELGFGQLRGAPKGIETPDAQSFSETLKSAISQVNEAQQTADKMSQDFVSGKGGNIHNLLLSMEKADLQLRTLMSVRNKTIEAYQEVMRMQV